jgi:uncharacterized protein YjiS (DUF1127 family)
MSAYANRDREPLTPRASLPLAKIGGIVKAAVRVCGRALLCLEEWSARAQERRDLRSLDDRMLKDIGVSRSDAEREGEKPFWKS